MDRAYDHGHIDHLKNILLWRSPGPGDNRGWTWQPGTEGVEILLHGRSWLTIDGHRQELPTGTMVWGQPGDRTLSEIDPAAPYHTLLIRFATTRPTRTRPPRLVAWNDPADAQSFAIDALEVFHRGGFDNRWFADYLYGRLWWQVHRATIAGRYGLLPPPLQAALTRIEREHAGRMAVADLARAAGLGPKALYGLFQRHLGTTPLAALTRRRIQAACALLVHDPACPVAEVGKRSGFGDPAHFGRVFRASQGCSPGAFRQRHADALPRGD